MLPLPTPISRDRLLSTEEVQRRLDTRVNLSPGLLAQVAQAFSEEDYDRAACASAAYDEAQDGITQLRREMELAEQAAAFLGHLATASRASGRVKIASIRFSPDMRYVRVGRFDLDDYRE